MSKFIDITGQRFGRLVVVKRAENNKEGRTRWFCKCDCGVEKIVNRKTMIGGYAKSCGCLRKETTRKRSQTHAMTGSHFYVKWENMKIRCLYKKGDRYRYYGERGIKVCERWKKFLNFKDDMYESYLKHVEEFGERDTTLERANFDGNYNKNNCCWKTLGEQANNKSSNRFITFKNQTMTLSNWSQKLNIEQDTLRMRLDKCNWTVEKTLTTPVRKKIKLK